MTRASIIVCVLAFVTMGSDCEKTRIDSFNEGLMETSTGLTLGLNESTWTVVGRRFEHPESFELALDKMNGWFDSVVYFDAVIDEELFLELELLSDELRYGTILVSEGFVGTPEWDDAFEFEDDGGVARLRWDEDGNILFADIVVNVDYAYDGDWSERTIEHELGHTVGLAHDGDSLDLGSCMSSPPPVGCRILQSDVDAVSNRLDN